MKRIRTIFVLIAASLLPALSSTQATEGVRISVPASMTDAMKELAAQFGASGQHAPVVANYGPSGTLAKQIVEGAPADLFISANQKWMNYLRDEKQIDPATEKILAANTLVFVGMKNQAVTKMEDITGLKQVAIGSPKSVPAGEYAVQAMEKAGVYQQLDEGKKLVMAKDVRQALTYADRGETDGAFVYKSDALMATQAVILFEVDQELYAPVTYPIVLTVAGAQNGEAKAFYDFLIGPEGRKVFLKFGFSAAK
jgi:molybdate transport system substrate-binding protein